MKLNDLSIRHAAALPAQPIAEDVLREKYAKGDEKTIADVRKRIARALAAVEAPARRDQYEQAFFAVQEAGFIPGGRICSAAGTDLKATLINCFVQPIGDSISADEKTPVGIYDALQEAAETMRRGGGVGYDFSPIRPAGAWVKGTQSSASGPLSYMRVFDESCKTVESAGSRRGAQMGILRCDHPDVREFVHAKDGGDFKNFNLSVTLHAGVHGGRRGRPRVAARAHGNAVRRAPGRRCASAARWPVGVSHGARARPVERDHGVDVRPRRAGRDLHRHGELATTISRIARRSRRRIRAASSLSRPTVAATWAASISPRSCTIPSRPVQASTSTRIARPSPSRCACSTTCSTPRYGRCRSSSAKRWPSAASASASPASATRCSSSTCATTARTAAPRPPRSRARPASPRIAASVEIAKEKGAFPLFDADRYLAAPSFASRLPLDLQSAIRAHGIRNSHLMSIAPTGTISLAFADNASNGIEPPFSWRYTRRKRMPDDTHEGVHRRGSRLPAVEARARHRRRGDARRFRRRRCAAARPRVVRRRRQALRHAAVALRDRARDERARSHAHERRGPAVGRQRDQQDGERSGRLSVRGLRGLVSSGLEGGAQGHHDVPAQRGAGCRAERRPKLPPTKEDLDQTDPDRRVRLQAIAEAPLASLRWPGRPELPNGNPCWTYVVRHPHGDFAVFIGHVENGSRVPFEVWVNGAEQPRGLGALAKTLSMDMRAEDRRWLDKKLSALARTTGRRRLRSRDAACRCRGARAEPRGGLRGPRALSLRRAGRVRRRERAVSRDGRVDGAEGAEGRHRRHAELDRRRRESRDRRRLRDVPEGAADARRPAPPVFDVALGRISEGVRRPVQGAVARHARHRSCVDRDEAAQAPQLRREQRRVHGAHARHREERDVSLDHRLPRAASSSIATRCSAS